MFRARILILAILAIPPIPVAAADDDLAALNDPMGVATQTVTDLYPKTTLLRDLLADAATVAWESNGTASRLAIDAIATEGDEPDVDQTVDHIPAPYELHGDGTDFASFRIEAGGVSANGRVCPGDAGEPADLASDLRCGGDIDDIIACAQANGETDTENETAILVCNALAGPLSTVDGIVTNATDNATAAIGNLADIVTCAPQMGATDTNNQTAQTVCGAIADADAPSCSQSADVLACANDPVGILFEVLHPMYDAAYRLIRDLVRDAAPVWLGRPTVEYEDRTLLVYVDADDSGDLSEGEDPLLAPDPVPAPYELHGDGTTYANAGADGGYYARICPGRVDPGAVDPADPFDFIAEQSVALRCGGDLDGDGEPDTWELPCSNPIQTGNDDLCPELIP